MNYKKNITQAINRELGISLRHIDEFIEVPSRVEMGDFAFPCFKLSNIINKPPNIIAKELKEKLCIDGFEKIENLDAYVNFFLDKSIFIKGVLEKIIIDGNRYGYSKIGEGKCICIECFSYDITKPLNLEQLITIVIGNSLCNLFERFGYEVKKISYSKDWSIQFSKLLGNEIKGASLKENKELYSLLKVKFDSEEEESFYNNRMKILFNELMDKGLISENDGSKLIMLDKFNLPPFIILKDDKVNTYQKINLATAIHRKEKYDFYKCIYIAGNRVKTQFKQVFRVLELAGYEWVKDCMHVGFGLVKFNDIGRKMRYGDQIVLNNVIKEVINKILNTLNEKNIKLEDINEFAKKIGIGGIIFTCLRSSREKNILFDWEEMFLYKEGSYLYVQYSYSRAINMLSKSKESIIKVNFSNLNSIEEFELAKSLEKFNIVINDAIEILEPSIILVYIIEVTKKMNKIYDLYKVDKIKDRELMRARLGLIKAICQVINNALDLIGIEAIEEYDVLHELIT